jgi:hypothetical protein
MPKRLALVLAAASAGSLVILAAPANAGQGVTFTLTAGSLVVSDPGNTSLGTVAVGTSTVSSQLGTVTVTDARGALNGSWTSTVTSTDFTTGGATANETIGKALVDYWSGAATSTTGVAVFLPGQLLVANKQALGSARTAYSASAVIGNTSATWNPTVVVNVPAAAVAGTYSGTVTHSITGG